MSRVCHVAINGPGRPPLINARSACYRLTRREKRNENSHFHSAGVRESVLVADAVRQREKPGKRGEGEEKKNRKIVVGNIGEEIETWFPRSGGV